MSLIVLIFLFFKIKSLRCIFKELEIMYEKLMFTVNDFSEFHSVVHVTRSTVLKLK